MENESRVHKSWLNAKINLIYYFLFIILSFFSRKIFFDSLGAEFTGLQGTIQSILGYLNLAEFGISTAIAFNLYKPIKDGDKEKIKDLVSMFGYMYRFIGSIVLIGGIIVAFFLPLIFKNSGFSLSVIILCYLAFLLSSLYGYFLNYKQILLTADQKAYIITKYYQGAQMIAVLLQMGIAYFWQSYIGVILVQMLYGVAYCYILENRLKKEYPWFKVDVKRGKEILKQYPKIIKSTKQIFIHRIKDFMLSKSDQLFVFIFANLTIVAYYGNYALVLTKVQQLFATALDGLSASVGNLVAEGNKRNINKVFWELISMRYLVGGIVVFCIYYLIQPFISVWLGEKYLLGQDLVILLLANYYITQTRGVVDMFNNAYGQYADVWAAWVELAIYLSVTAVVGFKIGFIGVLIGKLASMVPVVVFWKPYYLFHSGFKASYWNYWKGILKHLIALAMAWIVAYYLIQMIPINPYEGYGQLLAYGIINFGIFAPIFMLLEMLFAPGTKDLLFRVPVFRKINFSR